MAFESSRYFYHIFELELTHGYPLCDKLALCFPSSARSSTHLLHLLSYLQTKIQSRMLYPFETINKEFCNSQIIKKCCFTQLHTLSLCISASLPTNNYFCISKQGGTLWRNVGIQELVIRRL